MKMSPIQVGLLGIGTVGSGTFRVLQRNQEEIRRRAGRGIVITMVADLDTERARGIVGDQAQVVADARQVIANPAIDIVIELIGGYQSIKDLVAPGGRLCRQRDLAYELLSQIPGVSVVKPKAALYMFPRLDPKMYPISDDQQFAYELLAEEKVLVVQGSGFNWPAPDHFRLVFLPNSDDLHEAIGRIARFLGHYRKRHSQ